MTQTRPAPPLPLQGERLVADRIVGFTALLPGRPPSPAAYLATGSLADALAERFPAALALDPVDPTVGVAPRSLGMLVVDTRLQPLELLRPLLAPRAVVATIGEVGEHVIYPDLATPELVWRRGWPLPDTSGLGAQVRRNLGLLVSRARAVPRLHIQGGPIPSLADAVAHDLSAAVEDDLELVGIISAGHLVLRFRGSNEYAVRFASIPPHDQVSGETVARDVPAIAAMVTPEVASGTSYGYGWTATPWVSRRCSPLLHAWRRARRSWDDAELLVTALEDVVTGHTAPGWAHGWLQAVPQIPDGLRPVFLRALQRLEAGLPTGWCHGDPWPGNIMLDGRRPVVIDWDNAARDAPLGLDRILLTALRRHGSTHSSIARACVDLVDRPQLVPHRVAGRSFSGWDRPTRGALALTAFLVHLRDRPGPHPAGRKLTTEFMTMADLVDDSRTATNPGDRAPESSLPRSSSLFRSRRSSAVRGALWLGLGALVVKSAQTTVLLVLAALLDPSAMGVLAIGSLVLNAASSFTDLGSSTALVYWRGDAERAGRSAMTLALGTSLLLVACGWVIAPWLSSALHAGPDATHVVRGLILALPFSAVSGVSRELLRREMAFGRRVMPDIVAAVVSVPVALVVALQGHGIFALVASQLVQSVLTMLLCWTVRSPVRLGWRRADVGALVGYGRHLAGANILQLLMLNIDYLVVARILGPGPLGQYSIAFRLAYMPYLLGAVVIGGAAFPYLCRLRGGQVGRSAEQVLVLALTVLVPMYVGMALLASHLELLGHQWAPAVPVVPWLAGYGLLLSLVQMCLVPLNSVSRTRDTFSLTLLHLVLLAALLLALTHAGVTAVAIAQFVAASVTALAALALARRRVDGFRIRAVLGGIAPALLGAIAMACMLVVLRWLLPWGDVSVTSLVTSGVLGVTAYAVPVWALRRGLPLPTLLEGGAA